MAFADKGRMDVEGNAVFILAGNGQELDDIAHFRGMFNIFFGNVFNAFYVDIVEGHSRMEAQRGQDGDLAGCIVTADIVRRVRFGIAFFLGFFEDVFIGRAVGRHVGQDEVRRAVHDTDDFFDTVAVERRIHGTDDRDTAGYAGFELEVHVVLLGQFQQRNTVIGDEVLIGADDALAAQEALFDAVLGKVGTAHDFDDDFDFIVVDDVVEIRRELDGIG